MSKDRGVTSPPAPWELDDATKPAEGPPEDAYANAGVGVHLTSPHTRFGIGSVHADVEVLGYVPLDTWQDFEHHLQALVTDLEESVLRHNPNEAGQRPAPPKQ